MLSKLSEILTIFFYILIFSLLINGCFHSFKKHKDDPSWLQESPLAIYRGIEYFWHDDFAGVDWKERNQRDMKMVSYFFLKYLADSAKYKLLKEVDEFSNDIVKYPPKQLAYLKTGAKEYILMDLQISSDVKKYCVNYFKGDTSAFMYSEESNNYLTHLKKKFYFEEDMSSFELNKTLHNRLRIPEGEQKDRIEVEHYLELLDNNYSATINNYKIAYKDIFKEAYK